MKLWWLLIRGSSSNTYISVKWRKDSCPSSHVARSLTPTIFFLTDTTPKKGSLSQDSFQRCLTFYRRGNKGPERLKDVLKVTKLLGEIERGPDLTTNLSYKKIRLYPCIWSCVTFRHVTTSQSLSFQTSWAGFPYDSNKVTCEKQINCSKQYQSKLAVLIYYTPCHFFNDIQFIKSATFWVYNQSPKYSKTFRIQIHVN